MKKLIILFITCLLISCKRDDYISIPFDSKLVVEGWIEEGDVARVIVSRSIPINTVVDSSNFLNYVIRSAMVIVSDGTESDTLRLRSASPYFPPYMYIGEKIIGKRNEHYKLTVKHFGQEITAETAIPASVPINNVKYIKGNPADTIGNLTIEFTDPADENYYQISTFLEGFDDIFIPALYGNISDKNFISPNIEFKIMRGVTIFPHTNIETNYNDGDIILVKLRTMHKEGFKFWNSWQNEILNAQNPIFPANSNLKGNINGGIGIWCGYGQNTKKIVAK